ncbi:MAG TPA: GyrI-like domain-containing protein [Candidatus Lumbricidophila sp.]|nr:GyrI-like domain-containing protein [Candidatus Lumbricidophila sp.]
MTDIHIVAHQEQPTAVVRETVPMAKLTEFFTRAFSATMRTVGEQGTRPAGPPFGKYYGMPGAVVDVEAGFPVATPIAPAGTVRPGTLPGGRVAEAIHIGPYDTLPTTYAELERYFDAHGLTPASTMWECYLSGPESGADPTTWRTQICWPIE